MTDPNSLQSHLHVVPPNHSSSMEMRIKVIGVGGAGTNAIDRLAESGVSSAVELVACNTDVQALSSSLAAHKIQMGRRITRGLGAGGDPEVGFSAAEEALEELRVALQEVPLVLVCAGLGGGTGSGAAPLIVKMAREQGSLVLVCATLPFSFEGKRRGWQAQEALRAIQKHADAVICFENDRMGELITGDSNITEAFAGADVIIGQAVRAVVDLVNRRGLIHLGFDDLFAALRNHDARCLFGYGEAEGDNRAFAALEHALKSPLMDQGNLLSAAANVLVNIVGGEDLTLAEVQAIMEKLTGFIHEHTHLLFGAAVDPHMGNRIGVTVISSLSARGNVAAGLVPSFGTQANMGGSQSHRMAAFQSPSISPQEARFGLGSHAASQTHYPPTYTPHYPNLPPSSAPAMPTDPAARGRFEKSQPTIIDGEDLDVPTYVRKNLHLR